MAEPQPDPPPLPELLSDQASRWQRGDRVRVEDYLRRYPRLSENEEALLDLVYAEAVLAQKNGETIRIEKYESRFPTLKDRLRRQFAVHQAVGFSYRDDPHGTGTEPATTPEVRPRGGPALPALPGYEILGELGRGGMGVVYQARQLGFNRVVALKMVREASTASPDEVARFRVEAEAVGRLGHPHIVQVHAFGEHAGLPYFAMEYLEGGSLARRLARGPLPEREAAQLVAALARGVHAAHQAGVVHRDLKPGNVLLAADGTPKVSDFGLAKLLDAQFAHTDSRALLGTAEYMAPEAAAGRAREVQVPADVYALGAILYECLAGRPPFRGQAKLETLELVRTQEPAPPGRLRPGLSRDLEAVCLKCLEKQPGRRYESAAALADDLGRWLRGEPTAARPVGWAGRQQRRLRRRPKLAAAVAVGLLLAGGLLGTAFWPKPPPEDPVGAIKAIEARLDQGEKVELVGKTGDPAWSRLLVGERQTQLFTEDDDTFSIRAEKYCLLELARDPRWDRYRIRAEVRHRRSEEVGAVGFYFARREYADPEGPIHFGLTETFDDVHDEIERFKILPDFAKNRPPPKGNAVHLKLQWFTAGTQGKRWDVATGACARELFRAAGPFSPTWRVLAVEVAPERVRAFWGEPPQLVGEVVPGDLVKEFNKQLDWVRKKRPGEGRGRGVAPEFLPRGGLGLYVMQGSASFRRVSVEPLVTNP
jgi:serine/threonine-protein kinase